MMALARRIILAAVLAMLTLGGHPRPQGALAHDARGGNAVADMEMSAIRRLFENPTVNPALFSAGFLKAVPIRGLQQGSDGLVQALGPYRSVTPQQAHQYFVNFRDGLVRAYILLDKHGRIDALSTSHPKLSTDRVLVGGYRTYLHCQGTGRPTVVLEAGLADDSGSFDPIVPSLVTYSRVCGYDRAGDGGSDARPGARTSAVSAGELHALLAQVRIPGPIVLVGHSIAGFHLRVFASRYPRDVAGMVMIDCSSPDQLTRLAAALGPARPKESASVATFRKGLADYSNPEGFDLPGSAAQVQTTGSLGSIPLVVLTAGAHDVPVPAPVARRFEAAWLGMQVALAALSTDSVHVLMAHSGHYIHQQYPGVVVQAVREVLDAVRSRSALPGCSKTFPAFGGSCFPAT